MAPVGSVPAANPRTYIESGAVASDISGATDAPSIEPVAKITAEFAPVSACAAASLTTLERARASPELSSAAVTSIIRSFRSLRRAVTRAGYLIPATMKWSVRPINRRKRASGMRLGLWLRRSLKHQRQVVGGHVGDFDKGETGATRQLFQRLNIAHAPLGIAFSQACVKHLVADGRVLALALQ